MSGKLDDRLIAVAAQIRSNVHADIGSDHGSLLAELLHRGKIEYGIAIENKQLPFENSARALRGMNADVRLGDGLQSLRNSEADSLSICGMGAESMRQILLAYPDRIPDRVVLQLFHKPEIIRRWALDNGYHLLSDTTTLGKRRYTILSYQRSKILNRGDPAYENIDRELALLFGPFVLKREDRQFDLHLQTEEAWWRDFDRLSEESAHRLELLRKVMADRGIEPVA